MSGRPVEIVLVDDHRVMRDGLRSLLATEPAFTVVGEAASLADLPAVVVTPDVVLCDLVLGDGRGREVVEAVHARFPDAAILVLSMIDNPSDIQQAFAAGARGYVPKEAPAEDLLGALELVARGEVFVHPSLGAALAGLQRVSQGVHMAADVSLSDREREVLQLLALGHTNSEIAGMLHVSVRTVESHRASLLHKLDLHSRADLVRYASKHGLL